MLAEALERLDPTEFYTRSELLEMMVPPQATYKGDPLGNVEPVRPAETPEGQCGPTCNANLIPGAGHNCTLYGKASL